MVPDYIEWHGEKYNFFLDINGEKESDQERILAWLLMEDYVFVNGRKYICISGEIQPETTVVFANCNDTFAWGTADAESITADELADLYNEIKKDERWGSTKWVCKKRNMQPQKPIIKDMKKDNSWTEEMKNLPKNGFGE